MATYTHAYAESNGFLTLLERRRAADRRATRSARRPASGSSRRRWRSAPGPARRAVRHHPAVPELLRDPRVRPEGAAGRDREERAMSALAGQTVVVIGGSAGIGLGTARLARAEGAEVVLTGRNPERLEGAAREIGARSTAAFDATDFAALERFFDDLPTPVDHVMVTAGVPVLRAAGGDGPRQGARGRGGAPPAAAARGPPRRRQGTARGHAALHRRHRRAPPRRRAW